MANYYSGEGIYTKLVDESNNLISASNPLEVTTLGGALGVVGGGTEAAALRVTVASDSTGVLTVDNPSLSVTGGGLEATAMRVTLASDSTGQVAVASSALPTGAATDALQTSGNSILSNIDNGLNLGRITNNVYTADAISSGDTASEIIMGDFKDRYGSIHIVGDSSSVGYKFVLEFSTDNTNFYSDGIESLSYLSGGRYQFSVTRTNIGTPYIRIKSIAAGVTVNMSYSLTK